MAKLAANYAAGTATAFTIVKFLGAAYLVYIRAKMLLAPRNGNEAEINLRTAAVSLPKVFRCR